MILFIINIIIAFVWMLLAAEETLAQLFMGFVMGFIMIAAFRPILQKGDFLKHQPPKKDYVLRTVNLIVFSIWFFFEFLKANLNIAWAILTRPNSKITPNIFTIDVTNLTSLEILLLTHCITLTPGTTTIKISEDQNTVYVHAFDGDEIKEERDAIENKLMKRILAFTR